MYIGGGGLPSGQRPTLDRDLEDRGPRTETPWTETPPRRPLQRSVCILLKCILVSLLLLPNVTASRCIKYLRNIYIQVLVLTKFTVYLKTQWKYHPKCDGVFTLAWSGTGTGTGTGTCIMQNVSNCTGTWKNGLYGFNKNLSHCT